MTRSRARQADRTRDAEAPRYLFALATAHVRAGHRDDAVKWATEAKTLAERYGDTALAAAIERDLAKIKMTRTPVLSSPLVCSRAACTAALVDATGATD